MTQQSKKYMTFKDPESMPINFNSNSAQTKKFNKDFGYISNNTVKVTCPEVDTDQDMYYTQKHTVYDIVFTNQNGDEMKMGAKIPHIWMSKFYKMFMNGKEQEIKFENF